MFHQITFQDELARCLSCGRVFDSVQELLRDQECERRTRIGEGQQVRGVSSTNRASQNRVAQRTSVAQGASEGTKAQLLFIVARDNSRLYRYLTKQLSGAQGVRVILEQRQGERRRRFSAHSPKRRKSQRRRQPMSEDELRSYGFIIIHQP